MAKRAPGLPEGLPAPLVDRMTGLLGSRDALERLLGTETRPALRVNTLKTDATTVRRRLTALGLELEPVPFAADEAFFYHDPEDRPIGLTWEHQAGYVFSQDAASLLPVMALDPRPGERVLDLAAAPGGKATHIAQRMQNAGMVVANDPNPGRVNNMISNMDRMGTLNVVASQMDAARLQWPVTFDRVLVDAPCSNLGHMHQDWGPAFKYDPAFVGTLVGIQRGLMASAFHACKPGGTIVYATCTLEPRENEGAVAWFLDHFPVDVEPIADRLGVKGEGLTQALGETYPDEVTGAVRLHPGDAGTDGFFLCRFTKVDELEGDWDRGRTGNWKREGWDVEPEGLRDAVVGHYGLDENELLAGSTLLTSPRRVYATTVPELGEAFQVAPKRIGVQLASEEPDGYRMSFDGATLVGRDATRSTAVDEDAARHWLRGDKVPAVGAEAWSVLTCEDEPIGCARDFGAELPCYVPKQRRVKWDEGSPELFGFLAART